MVSGEGTCALLSEQDGTSLVVSSGFMGLIAGARSKVGAISTPGRVLKW